MAGLSQNVPKSDQDLFSKKGAREYTAPLMKLILTKTVSEACTRTISYAQSHPLLEYSVIDNRDLLISEVIINFIYIVYRINGV